MPPLRQLLGLLALTLALGAPVVAEPQPRAAAPMAVLPDGDPAYDALWQLYTWGMPMRRFGAFPGARYTRYQYALALRLSLADLGGAEGVRSSFSADVQSQALRLFRRLADDLAPELESLGLEVASLRAELDAAGRRLAPDSLAALGRALPDLPLTQRLVLRELWQPPVSAAPLPFEHRRTICPTGRLPSPPPRQFLRRPRTAPLLGLAAEPGAQP